MKYKDIKKLYYSISEVSEMLGVKQSVIRYWESEFKELKPQKNRAGNRIYKKDDIAILKMIHYYVYERHLSISEANDVITDLKQEGLYKRKLDELDKRDFVPAKVEENEDEEKVEMEEFGEEEELVPEEEAVEFENEIPVPVPELQPEIPAPVQAPKVEIAVPTEETFIYPLDNDRTDIIPEAPAIIMHSEEPEENLPEEFIEPEPMPVPEQIIKPKPEPAVVEPVRQNDAELKALLKKISENIKDIIDILNE